jgi:hypothetical protein
VFGQPAGERHGAARRLEADHTAVGGRDPQRAAAVGAQRERHHAGRDGRRAAAGGAAGVAGQVAGIAGAAVRTRLGEPPDRQLRHAGLADDDRAGRAQPPHQLVVGGFGGIRRRRRPVPGGQPGDRDVVLDRQRYAGERQLGEVGAARQLGRGAPGLVRRDALKGADARVAGRDPGEAGVDNLARGTPPGAHGSRDLDGGFADGGGGIHAGDRKAARWAAHRAIALPAHSSPFSTA